MKKYQRIRAFSAELDRGYCLQAQFQSAAFRSNYVLGSHVAQCLPNQLRFGTLSQCVRDEQARITTPPHVNSVNRLSHRITPNSYKLFIVYPARAFEF